MFHEGLSFAGGQRTLWYDPDLEDYICSDCQSYDYTEVQPEEDDGAEPIVDQEFDDDTSV